MLMQFIHLKCNSSMKGHILKLLNQSKLLDCLQHYIVVFLCGPFFGTLFDHLLWSIFQLKLHMSYFIYLMISLQRILNIIADILFCLKIIIFFFFFFLMLLPATVVLYCIRLSTVTDMLYYYCRRLATYFFTPCQSFARR